MTEVSLHPLPRWRDVVLEQIRIVGLSLRREALVAVAILIIATFMIAKEILTGGQGFDSDDPTPTAVFSFLFPFAVWRSDKRFGPAFLWTLPVDRQRLAIARVFAGWVWLVAVFAFFVSWLVALGLLAGSSPAQTVARIQFTATLATYLFGSALVLGLRHPLRWLLGAVGLVFLTGTLSDLLHQGGDREWAYVPGAQAFFSIVQQTAATLRTLPDLTQWAISTALWFGAGLIALRIAIARHRETRRH